MNQQLIFLFVVWLIAGWQIVFAQSSADTLELQQLLKAGLKQNPALIASKLQAKAAEAKVPAAGALPDPQLTIGLLNLPTDSWRFDQEPMTGKQIALSQKIPFPGKLFSQSRIARKEAEIAMLNYRELQNQLQYRIRRAYYKLYYLDRELEINRQNKWFLAQLNEITTTLYKVGKGLQQDVLKVQVRENQVDRRLIGLAAERKAIVHALSYLTGLKILPEQPTPLQMNLPVLLPAVDSLVNAALRLRPLLQKSREQVALAAEKLNRARKDYWPDLGVQVAYTQRQELQNGVGGVDYFSVMANFSLPLYFWKKQKARVQESGYLKRTGEMAYEDSRLSIASEIESAVIHLQATLKELELLKSEIIPKSEQAYYSSLSAYQVDRIEFEAVISNLIRLFNFQSEFHRLTADYLTELAYLEFLTGLELTDSF